MSEKARSAFRRLTIRKGDDLKTIYAKVRRSFTAADLQRFTVIEEGIPAEEVVAKLKAAARKPAARRKKR
jgi:hypothetical protein